MEYCLEYSKKGWNVQQLTTKLLSCVLGEGAVRYSGGTEPKRSEVWAALNIIDKF